MQHTFCQLQAVLHYPKRIFKEGVFFELVGKKKKTHWKRGKLHTTRGLSFVRKEYIEVMIRPDGNSIPEFSYHILPCWQMFICV